MLPPIIQGGMGIAVSGWPLASAVSRQGQFGVVSGSGLAMTFAQRLQLGDTGGHLRHALDTFPVPAIVQRVLQQWFHDGGLPPGQKTRSIPMPTWPLGQQLTDLTILANYAEVFLARTRGGPGPIGLNLLTKVEIVTLPSLYGAMLAGVQAVFMGAGIPRLIPGALDALARGQEATLQLTVAGGQPREIRFSPADYLGVVPPVLARPAFFPIVSSDVLASILLRKSNGPIDGFIVENHTAGGHNAPPRRSHNFNSRGEPVWGEIDQPVLDRFRQLGLPFYVAGGVCDPNALRSAQSQGATGIQVGTVFAFCEESGICSSIKTAVNQAAARGDVEIVSDPRASPTGFPFKVLQLPGTLSDPAIYAARTRVCDAGYLRSAFEGPGGEVVWRCPAERESAYLAKGGAPEDCARRLCVCTALRATVGLGNPGEPSLVTAGADFAQVAAQLVPGQTSYHAADVIQHLLCRL